MDRRTTGRTGMDGKKPVRTRIRKDKEQWNTLKTAKTEKNLKKLTKS